VETGQRHRSAGACRPGASRALCYGYCEAKIWSWCRGLSVTAAELNAWRDAFLAAGEASLKTRPADGRDAEIGRLKTKVGDLTMAKELLETKIGHLEAGRPSASGRSPGGMSAKPTGARRRSMR
jgi:transposase